MILAQNYKFIDIDYVYSQYYQENNFAKLPVSMKCEK